MEARSRQDAKAEPKQGISTFSGVVLAAGRSTRMGRDKALLLADGVPLWRRQRDVLRQAGATELFLSARPDQPWAASADGFDAVVNDAFPDGGPIVGITAALERSSETHVAVLAIDLPHLPADWFTLLSAQCGPGRGCVARSGGFYEPLAALYPRELKWLAWEFVARGEYSLQKLLAVAERESRIEAIPLPPEHRRSLENWNEPPAPP